MFLKIIILSLISTIIATNESASFPTSSSIIAVKIHNSTNIKPINSTKDGKTYFFKYNTNNNQFRIYNRVNVNGVLVNSTNKYNNFTEPKMKSRNLSKVDKPNMNELRKFEAFLDEEWNYKNDKKNNNSELPFQVHPFLYNSIVEKMKNSDHDKIDDITKVIFNNHQNSNLLIFTLGKLEKDHFIDNAELHFYFSVAEDSTYYRDSCVLRLYEVGDNPDSSFSETNPDTQKLLNVIYVSKAQNGWQMFRINRKSIEKWANINENLKLLIAISQANQVNSSTIFNDTKNVANKRTFLVLKIENNSNETEEFIGDPNASNKDEIPHFGSSKYCSKQDFYIDFRKLHWSNFIIAPEGFMAYDCHGKCAKQNSGSFSNHMKLLTTFQDVDKKIRNPCCVPVKFYTLPIMFYDKSGNIVIKLYKNLITSECGCR